MNTDTMANVVYVGENNPTIPLNQLIPVANNLANVVYVGENNPTIPVANIVDPNQIADNQIVIADASNTPQQYQTMLNNINREMTTLLGNSDTIFTQPLDVQANYFRLQNIRNDIEEQYKRDYPSLITRLRYRFFS